MTDKSELEALESGCGTAQQFVDLAHGFKTLMEDDRKVDELLESGAEFAMGGEEFIIRRYRFGGRSSGSRGRKGRKSGRHESARRVDQTCGFDQPHFE